MLSSPEEKKAVPVAAGAFLYRKGKDSAVD